MRTHRFLYVSAGLARSCVAALVLLSAVCRASSGVIQVQSIGLTVNDVDSEVRFFTEVLPFKEVSRSQAKGRAVDGLLGLQDAQLHVVQLKLGDDNISLTEHSTKGRPIPADSQSFDHWFQHIAIVVSDMDQ